MMYEHRPADHTYPYRDSERLREEIAYMEARLDMIGYEGDCAYEKAMARFYDKQLAACRDQLRNM